MIYCRSLAIEIFEHMTLWLFFLCMHLLALNRCFGLLIALEIVLRKRRENKLASDLICSGFRLTFDCPGSPWFVCGDAEELPELLKLSGL